MYKELYFHDFERKDEINNSIAIIYGALPLIFAAGMIIAKELDAPFNNFEIWTILLLTFAFIPLLFSFFYLTKAYIRYKYSYIPYANDLYKYECDLKQYYCTVGQDKEVSQKSANEDIIEYLSEKYSEYSGYNQIQNERKLGLRYKGIISIIISMVLLVTSGIPYAINSVTQSEVQKVEIANIKEIIMATNQQNQQNQQGQTTQTQPQPSPQSQLTKPLPPAGRIIQESFTPPKR